eukprot:19689-Eustigmatos_ZCMA.PRE.1
MAYAGYLSLVIEGQLALRRTPPTRVTVLYEPSLSQHEVVSGKLELMQVLCYDESRTISVHFKCLPANGVPVGIVAARTFCGTHAAGS